MYSVLHNIFADKKGGEVFTCFSFWHFFYIFLIIASVAVLVVALKNKDRSTKDKVIKILACIPVILYALDFFAMPFAYGEIDIDKLPFHSCTSLSIMCFLCNTNGFFKKYRINFAMFAFFSNIMYIAYPSGVMSCEVHPLSYRAVQTLLFHSAMVIYTLIAIIYDEHGPKIKYCYRDLVILGGMTVWALIGNTLYSGTLGDYSHDFNWFFVKADPLGVLPLDIAPYIAPFINIIVFFTLEIFIYLIFIAIEKHKAKNQKS